MNTNNIKKYAPQARRAFISAVMKRLNELGIYSDQQIAEASIQGELLIIEGRSVDIAIKQRRERLIHKVQQFGFVNFVEHIAYTWFNRLCAIRFMELKGDYLEHGLRVLSHPEKASGFEILDHAQDVAEGLGLDRNHIVELKLAGNQDEALYRLLLLGQCHQLHQAMPFLFEALDDETELLLPDNLTRTDSILRGLVDNIPENDWQPVEIIGWLYQFYISEKKDQVIGSVVKSEDIPAATQLFTPNWIVKYLVQNSVGRQWLMTYPDSGLKAQMEYYIEPAEQEPSVVEALAAITPTSIDPETLKVLDPACGSGHILVEAYDILKAIYEERGYRVRDIPKLILEKNLYGLDIDDRAAQLAGFALMMKAREDDRRIFTRDIKLNVLAIQSTQHLFSPPDRHSGMDCRNPDHRDVNSPNHPWPLDPGNPCRGDALADLWRRLDIHGQAKRGSMESIFDDVQSNLADTVDDIEFKQLRAILGLFEQAKTFGSLIQVPQEQAEYLRNLTSRLRELIEQGDSMQIPAATALVRYVQQAWLLAQQYDAVVANPPYMGGKGMNSEVKEFAKKLFTDSKSDLFAIFIERGFALCKPYGFNAQVTMQGWMFLSSFEMLREKLLKNKTISTLVQIGYNSFPEINSKIAQACAFSILNMKVDNFFGSYINLNSAPQAADKKSVFIDRTEELVFEICQDSFNNIPGMPLAYSASSSVFKIFKSGKTIESFGDVKRGMTTSDNDQFLRYWVEVSTSKCFMNAKNSKEALDSCAKWFPYSKGGGYRKWYGLIEFLINWENDGKDVIDFAKTINLSFTRTIVNIPYYFKASVGFSYITSGPFSMRLIPTGCLYDSGGPGVFVEGDQAGFILACMNSNSASVLLKILIPTIALQIADVVRLPLPADMDVVSKSTVISIAEALVKISRFDWDSYETSWDFTENPLISQKQNALLASFEQWQLQNCTAFAEMQRLEEENNRLFIEAYGLQDELSPEVPEDQISLTQADQEKDIQRLISYAIGCMMGRYRLDRPGLIYAHAGNVDFEAIYNAVGANSFAQSFDDAVPGRINSPLQNPFPADEDGILPLTDQEWFKDDASNRFREFLLAVWGEDTLQQNLEFVAESLSLSSFKPKKGETSLDTVRRYLSNQFYKDHLQTYKKRPIYWLFSSGKQKAFECLVYLHRYNDSTLARMRTEYVTPLLGKYSAYADQLNQQMQDASSSEATRIKKDMLALEKKQTELRQFDDKLKHYADMRIKLDLDDGVKVNYGKFGDLLAEVKAVTGSKGD